MTDAISNAISGLKAQSTRVAVAASNIANASSTGAVPDSNAPAGKEQSGAHTVYKPLRAELSAQEDGGVSARVEARHDAYSVVKDEYSPDANDKGEIAAPNVDLASEAIDTIDAKAAFKANLAVISAEEEMNRELLDVLS